MMTKILLITPPFVQPNTPYPATAYLKGYLGRKGICVEQYDLSVDLLGRIFSSAFLEKMFQIWSPASFDSDPEADDELYNIERIYSLRHRYITVVDTVMSFLRGEDPTIAHQICMPDFIPQARRFETMADIETLFGSMGTVDCAKYISTLFLQDISDFIRSVISPGFEITRYEETIAVSVPSFKNLEATLAEPLNLIEKEMVELLAAHITEFLPDFVGFTIPFPGNLIASLRCARHIKLQYPDVKTIAGGGYPTTELRSMSDRGIYKYFDYIILDDGELALERILNNGKLINTFHEGKFHESEEKVSHLERGCPDFSGLANGQYFSLCESVSPMQRLWSDGRWNKMTIAHGCYWAKCAFCDTSLDYICRYDSVDAATLVDWMERVAAQTGSSGFHFTDEAAPPKLLKEISLELIKRRLNFSWWTNIRFEEAFTGDLCRLMATAGCIAVSGGLEVASDRLLDVMNKGVTIESATISMRNFYYAGIMVHAYLMYGFPTQTLQETVDALETVRQMFRAELIGSAFWHRYAMTVHSPSGRNPEQYGVKRKNTHVNTFANNEVHFVEDRVYNVAAAGEALNAALANYMAGAGLERPVHKWFAGKAPQTAVEPTEITDHLIKPDRSRLYSDKARLVWLGTSPVRTEEGIVINSPSAAREFKLPPEDADFFIDIMCKTSQLDTTFTFADISEIYGKYSNEPFARLYHSKKWDQLREFGLLQL